MIMFYILVAIFAIIGFGLCATLLFLKFVGNWEGGVAGIEDELADMEEENQIYREKLIVFLDSLSEEQEKNIPIQLKEHIDEALKTPDDLKKEKEDIHEEFKKTFGANQDK